MSDLMKDIYLLKKLWPFLKKMKFSLAIALLFVPLIAGTQMLIPLTLKKAIDQGVMQKDFAILSYFCLIYFFLRVFDYVFRSVQAIFTSASIHKMIRELRLVLIEHIFRLKQSFHDQSMSGTLVTRATSDFDSLSDSLNEGLLTTIVDLSVLCSSIIGLYYLRPFLSFSVLMILPFVFLMMRFFTKVLKDTMMEARRKIGILNGFTQESIYGIQTVKILNAKEQATTTFTRYNDDFRKSQMQNVIADASMFAVLDGVSTITIGLVLGALLTQFFSLEYITAGVLIAFVQYLDQIFEPIKQLGNKMANLQGAITATQRIFALLEKKDFIEGTKDFSSTSNSQNFDITFQDVSFTYQVSQKPQLSGIEFKIPEGSSLAIVGSTGSGKSTLVKLLLKLYDGFKGEIFIGQQKLRDLDRTSWLKFVSVVPQDVSLFEGSLEFNISLGREGITRADVKEALRITGMLEFVESLPGQYEFILKEGGTNLSQGQKQLLSFARALVTKPRVIVLDEATSAVDQASELLIQEAIDKLFSHYKQQARHTLIVIAHRLSTIEHCDQILVLERGQILELGSHSELLKNSGKYQELHKRGL